MTVAAYQNNRPPLILKAGDGFICFTDGDALLPKRPGTPDHTGPGPYPRCNTEPRGFIETLHRAVGEDFISRAFRTIAAASGCPDRDSMVPAIQALPSLKLPLKAQNVRDLGPADSQGARLVERDGFHLVDDLEVVPPLKTVPCLAAFAIAPTTATGTERARPHEQETTKTTRPR